MNQGPEGFPGAMPTPPGIDPELWAAWARAGFPSLPPMGWPPAPQPQGPPPGAPPWAQAPWGALPWPPTGFQAPPQPPPPLPKGGLGALFGGDPHGLLHTLAPWFDFSDKDFLKGALLGAAAIYLLTNDGAQDALFKGAAKATGKVKARVRKARAAYQEAAEEAPPAAPPAAPQSAPKRAKPAARPRKRSKS